MDEGVFRLLTNELTFQQNQWRKIVYDRTTNFTELPNRTELEKNYRTELYRTEPLPNYLLYRFQFFHYKKFSLCILARISVSICYKYGYVRSKNHTKFNFFKNRLKIFASINQFHSIYIVKSSVAVRFGKTPFDRTTEPHRTSPNCWFDRTTEPNRKVRSYTKFWQLFCELWDTTFTKLWYTNAHICLMTKNVQQIFRFFFWPTFLVRD